MKTRTRRWLLGVAGALLLAVLAVAGYVANRGGHYPSHPVAGFSTLALPPAGAGPADDPVVRTSTGALRGTSVGPVVAFRGIPYARPPTGALRWQPPQPPVPWADVRDARHPGAACSQPATGLRPFFGPMARAYGADFVQGPVESSEDCLYLDVWAPNSPVAHPLPVMVWLHGGSNTFGSGAQPMYDGVSLVRRGVLLVTLNYRLGAMGFFSHPALTAESPHHSSGNYGLLDQLSALTWVRENIGLFGGDPDNVTVFGESAGGIDAARLMTSPLAAGLFERVISQSGPAFTAGLTLAEAEDFGREVAALAPAAGNATAATLADLRALPAAEVDALVARAAKRHPVNLTDATADGWVLPLLPQPAFLAGSLNQVDLLIGLNGRELSAFRISAAAAAAATGGADGGAATAALRQSYDTALPYFGAWTKPAIALYLGRMLLNKNAGVDEAGTDLLAACPIGAMASLASAAGAHVFLYRFNRSIPGSGEADLGAFHGLEVPYVFGTLNTQEWQWLPTTPDDALLSGLLQTYWTNFAKSGNPNGPGLPDWPAFTDARNEFLVINRDASVTLQRNFAPLLSSLKAAELKRSFQAVP